MRTPTGTRGRAHPDVQRRRGAGHPAAPGTRRCGSARQSRVRPGRRGHHRQPAPPPRHAAGQPALAATAIRLSRALVATLQRRYSPCHERHLASLADGLGPIRLALLTVGSIAGVVPTIVPWRGSVERPPRTGSGREQVIMFNLVTLATVVIGVLALYTLCLPGRRISARSPPVTHRCVGPQGRNKGVRSTWAVPWVRAWKPTRQYAGGVQLSGRRGTLPLIRTFGGHSRRTRLTGDRCEDPAEARRRPDPPRTSQSWATAPAAARR